MPKMLTTEDVEVAAEFSVMACCTFSRKSFAGVSSSRSRSGKEGTQAFLWAVKFEAPQTESNCVNRKIVIVGSRDGYF